MRQPLYRVIAARVNQLNTLKSWMKKSGDSQESRRAGQIVDVIEAIGNLVDEHMPSGSGFDSGTEIDLDQCVDGKLVFTTAFHHMDEHGGYDGWTNHTVTVSPDLQFGKTLTIDGEDRNDFLSYAYDTFGMALEALVEDGTTLESREDEAVRHLTNVMNDAPMNQENINAARAFLDRIKRFG